MLVAGWLLQREMVHRGRDPEPAFTLAIAGLVGGFIGAKLYFLAENAGGAMDHGLLSASGFTWYGGLLGGALSVCLTQPQLWSLALAALGAALLARERWPQIGLRGRDALSTTG
jgi:phosphatidylglycerol:prolipoprotein diacylglycerol transferase